MSHGVLPQSMLSVTLVPVIKDKAGEVGSIDNYRPVALGQCVIQSTGKDFIRSFKPVYFHNRQSVWF